MPITVPIKEASQTFKSMDVYPTITLKGERWYTERLLEVLLLKNDKYPSIS